MGEESPLTIYGQHRGRERVDFGPEINRFLSERNKVSVWLAASKQHRFWFLIVDGDLPLFWKVGYTKQSSFQPILCKMSVDRSAEDSRIVAELKDWQIF